MIQDSRFKYVYCSPVIQKNTFLQYVAKKTTYTRGNCDTTLFQRSVTMFYLLPTEEVWFMLWMGWCTPSTSHCRIQILCQKHQSYSKNVLNVVELHWCFCHRCLTSTMTWSILWNCYYFLNLLRNLPLKFILQWLDIRSTFIRISENKRDFSGGKFLTYSDLGTFDLTWDPGELDFSMMSVHVTLFYHKYTEWI